MMDIVERLRRKEHDPYCGQCIDGRLSEEAAAEIEKLRKERDGLREALKDMDGYVSRADRYYLKPKTLAALKDKE